MGTPFKMNGFSGFGNSPMKQDKMKASQTKINAETGETIVDENPGSKKETVNEFFKNIETPNRNDTTKSKYINPIITKEEKNRKKTFEPAKN